MSKWGLIRKSYLVTLNQRVQGSSPCAPTNVFNRLADFDRAIPTSSRALIPTHRLVLFLCKPLSKRMTPTRTLSQKFPSSLDRARVAALILSLQVCERTER